MPEHRNATQIHKGRYIQTADPGAVGAGVEWLDTNTTPAIHKKRNAGDSGWDVILTPSAYALLAGATFTGDIIVPDEAYDATAWNGSLEVPTKNAVRDKIETLAGGSGAITAIAGATVVTDQATASTSYTDLTTAGPAVTITTGTEAYVTLSAFIYRSASAGGTGLVSFAVTGASSIAALDANIIGAAGLGGGGMSVCRRFKLTGLTAGSNIFTCKYRVDAGTFNFSNRSIVVEAV